MKKIFILVVPAIVEALCPTAINDKELIVLTKSIKFQVGSTYEIDKLTSINEWVPLFGKVEKTQALIDHNFPHSVSEKHSDTWN